MLLDLERRERPATNTRWLRIACVFALVAIVISVLLPIAVVIQANSFLAGLYALMFLAVGTILLVHNIEARRAGLLQGVLPWLGMATGVTYLVVGLSYMANYFTPALVDPVMVGLTYATQVSTTPVVTDVNAQNLGQLLYIVWAAWLGVKLSRASAVAPATAHSV